MKKLVLMLIMALVLACAGCDSGPEIAPAKPMLPSTEQEEEEELSTTLTLVLAGPVEEERADLVDAAQKEAESQGYTLSVVQSDKAEMQLRYLSLAREAGDRALLVELADREAAAEFVDTANNIPLIFIQAAPDDDVLSNKAVYVGNPAGLGTAYFRAEGKVCVRAAINMINGNDPAAETGLRRTGNKVTLPSDGMIGQSA